MTSYYSLSRTSTSSYISSHSSVPPLWDPRTTLEIEPDCRCVEVAPSKGRKCRNPIAAQNLTKANTILRDIAAQQPNADALYSKLQRLAEYLLCKRWHQPQSRTMADTWSDRMTEAYPRGAVQTSRRASGSRSSAVSTTSSSSSRSQRETLHDTIAAMQEALRVAERQLSELPYPSPPSSPMRSSHTVSRVSTSDISSLVLSRSSTINSDSPSSVSPIETPPIAPARAPLQPSRLTRTCARTHVRRRAIDDECPICREDFVVNERLVWCKNSCGRTVHRACFEDWRAQCVDEGRSVSCVICRADFRADCECEG